VQAIHGCNRLDNPAEHVREDTLAHDLARPGFRWAKVVFSRQTRDGLYFSPNFPDDTCGGVY